ncbi:MAG TPA: RlmE family RNA methyltransferase, partial [Candidatus Poseidoniaceae archaeon]
FKLLQIQEKFKLIRADDVVLDVGCHPGGWSQVAVELVGDGGKVIGVDLEPCQPVEGALLLVGDITESSTQERICSELDGRNINNIVSDISPDITGNWDIDQAVAMTLVADVLDFSLDLLCKGGSFITKIFQGVGVEELILAVKPYFSDVRRFSPMASRNSSSEVYLVCRNFMPWIKRESTIRQTYETLLDVKLNPDEEVVEQEVYTSFKLRKKK